MKTPSPKERRQARTREAILEAAQEIISTDGTDALSMRAIAQRIDYSPAGLYEYFGGKEEIITAVCEEGEKQLFALMDQVDKSLAPAEYLRDIGHAYIRFAMERPDHFLLMFSTPSLGQNEEEITGKSADSSAFGILLFAIRRGVEAGIFLLRPGLDLLTMAYAAWATVHGLAMLRATHLRDFPMDFDTADRAALANFGRGLMAAE
ncbi:MAG: TetR/AcrR family transcriptional regulator [Caldilineaceae bacterium]|nr:TetR/AcrR family transcriptional regulator [Caldilineaceae bacterium]